MKNRTLYLIITALCLWFAPGAFCQNTQMSIQDSRNGGVAIKLATVKVTSAYTANSTVVMICVTTTAWKGYFLDADSDLAKVEAAAP